MQIRIFNSTLSKNLLIFVILNVVLIDQQYLQKQTAKSRRILGGDSLFGALALEAIEATHSAAVSGPPLLTTNGTQAAAIPTTSSPVRLPAPRVKLNKCCKLNQHLDATQNCIAGNIINWVPLIFLINRKTYFEPKGSNPKFMTFDQNSRPFLQPSEANTDIDTFTEAQTSGCTKDELELFTGNGSLILFSNGSLFLSERSQLIDPRRFCVDHESALVCFPKDDKTQPTLKLKKCCGKNLRYNPTTKSCIFSSGNDGKLKLPLNETSYLTLYGFPECQEYSTSYGIADWHESQLHNETGHLQLKHKNLSSTEYCFEYLDDENSLTQSPTLKIFACLHHFSPDASENSMAAQDITTNKLLVTILNIGLVISVVFLAATLVAGYMMPSVHHVLHWRCQIYYVFCLFIGDLLLAYTQLSRSLELGSTACVLFASAMHFFFLSAFFWLNTMCFNIWWTFRDFRPSSLERNQELLRLRLYSAYAWGIPLVFTVIAVCIDQLPDTHLLRPGFGVRTCWFSGEHLSIFAYFFGPIGILLCANIVLFISTTHQLTCGLWKRDDVKSTTEKTALGKVCLKLVVVMGVTWIADIISWVVGGPHSAWFLTDLINALQGVFIFIVVGCQPQVWAACKRLCCPRSRQEITNTTNGVQHSSSSQGLPSMAACGAEITQNTSINNTTTISAAAGGNQTPTAKIPMETMC